jgi:hypothetical protein
MAREKIKPVVDYPRTNILETLQAELDECVALLRPHYPNEDDNALRERAVRLRPERYEKGRWPSAEEIEADKAKAEAAEAVKPKPFELRLPPHRPST